MHPSIQSFIEDWKAIRGKTLEFLETVPQSKMAWRPHKLLGTFGMQLRHLIKVQEEYLKGMKKGRIDFSDKSFVAKWETDKRSALSALKRLDKELFAFLKTCNASKPVVFVDGVYGKHTISILTVLSYLKDHEHYHQGVFTCYGRLAGLGKFRLM